MLQLRHMDGGPGNGAVLLVGQACGAVCAPASHTAPSSQTLTPINATCWPHLLEELLLEDADPGPACQAGGSSVCRPRRLCRSACWPVLRECFQRRPPPACQLAPPPAASCPPVCAVRHHDDCVRRLVVAGPAGPQVGLPRQIPDLKTVGGGQAERWRLDRSQDSSWPRSPCACTQPYPRPRHLQRRPASAAAGHSA